MFIFFNFGQYALLKCEYPSTPISFLSKKMINLLPKPIFYKFSQCALLRYKHPSSLILFDSKYWQFYRDESLSTTASELCSDASILQNWYYLILNVDIFYIGKSIAKYPSLLSSNASTLHRRYYSNLNNRKFFT